MSLDLNRATPSTTISSSNYNDNMSDIETLINNMRPAIYLPVLGTQEVQTDISSPIRISQDLTLDSIALDIDTAPTGSALIVDINQNGTTIFTTRPQIDAGSTSGGSNAVFNSTTISDGDILTFDIDQVGSSTAGEDLTIGVIFKF